MSMVFGHHTGEPTRSFDSGTTHIASGEKVPVTLTYKDGRTVESARYKTLCGRTVPVYMQTKDVSFATCKTCTKAAAR